jgi:hypothetical protein
MKHKEQPARRSLWITLVAAILVGLSLGPAQSASVASPAASCSAIAIASGVSINGFLNDQYRWYDSACRLRSTALARNDTSKGGNAKQFTYVLANGTTRTVNPGSNGAGGFGYVVAHLSNPSFAWSYGADDSPLGSGNSATSTNLFSGEHTPSTKIHSTTFAMADSNAVRTTH